MRLLAATAFLSLSIGACGAQRAAMEVRPPENFGDVFTKGLPCKREWLQLDKAFAGKWAERTELFLSVPTVRRRKGLDGYQQSC